jgi:hypothetical protein
MKQQRTRLGGHQSKLKSKGKKENGEEGVWGKGFGL